MTDGPTNRRYRDVDGRDMILDGQGEKVDLIHEILLTQQAIIKYLLNNQSSKEIVARANKSAAHLAIIEGKAHG